MQFFEVNLPFYKSQINIQSIFNTSVKDNKKSKITPPFSKKPYIFPQYESAQHHHFTPVEGCLRLVTSRPGRREARVGCTALRVENKHFLSI